MKNIKEPKIIKMPNDTHYTKEERETHIYLSDDDPENAKIYTRQRKYMSKINKMDIKEITQIEQTEDGRMVAMSAIVPARTVSLRLKNTKREGNSNPDFQKK